MQSERRLNISLLMWDLTEQAIADCKIVSDANHIANLGAFWKTSLGFNPLNQGTIDLQLKTKGR